MDSAGERGAVTVEAAIAVCTLVIVLTAALAAILATAAHLRCMDAAREAARLPHAAKASGPARSRPSWRLATPWYRSPCTVIRSGSR